MTYDKDDAVWAARPLDVMCDELERQFHKPLKADLDRLEELGVQAREANPELAELDGVFSGLRMELDSHLMKEENVLFPMIRSSGSAPPPPIQVMRHEHVDATDALEKMRRLSNNYRVPDGASEAHREFLETLERFDEELVAHIHIEDEFLFPRALAGG